MTEKWRDTLSTKLGAQYLHAILHSTCDVLETSGLGSQGFRAFLTSIN